MFTRPQRRIVVAAVALLGALVLTCVAAVVNRFAPSGTVGFLAQVLLLATMVPVVLVGFNALCDRCEPEMTDADEATTSRSGGKRIESEKARLTIPIELRGRFRAGGGSGVKRWIGQ